MKITCNTCRKTIPKSYINVATDIAYCPHCEKASSLSAMMRGRSTPRRFNPSDPVPGIKLQDRDGTWMVDASHRHPLALFLVPFTVVWAGGSLTGLYFTQLANGDFNIAQSLFGLPFISGSLVLICLTLMSLWGRTVVSVENGTRALVFMGVGAFGWYRRFDWQGIDEVLEIHNRNSYHITLRGSRHLSLGWGLSGAKRYFLANFLRGKLGETSVSPVDKPVDNFSKASVS